MPVRTWNLSVIGLTRLMAGSRLLAGTVAAAGAACTGATCSAVCLETCRRLAHRLECPACWTSPGEPVCCCAALSWSVSAFIGACGAYTPCFLQDSARALAITISMATWHSQHAKAGCLAKSGHFKSSVARQGSQEPRHCCRPQSNQSKVPHDLARLRQSLTCSPSHVDSIKVYSERLWSCREVLHLDSARWCALASRKHLLWLPRLLH